MARCVLARQDRLREAHGRCGQDMDAWRGVWCYEGFGEARLGEKAHT